MKRTRKGFTLVELLIVVAIIGVLASMMTISAGGSTASAKAATIYNNIRNIKTAGLLYKVQKGEQFKESEVTDENLKKEGFLDLTTYNQTNGTKNNIQYKVVPGSDPNGAYVICQFKDDTDKVAIAKALKGYKDVRIDDKKDDDNYTVGSFFYYTTPSTYSGGNDENYPYDVEFSF